MQTLRFFAFPVIGVLAWSALALGTLRGFGGYAGAVLKPKVAQVQPPSQPEPCRFSAVC